MSPPHRRRRVAALVVLIFVGFAVTTVTGLPGPGPIRRYPVADLEALTTRIDRVYPGCKPFNAPPLAYVDKLRSRVILRASLGLRPISGLPVLKLSASERAMIEAPAGDPGGFTSSPSHSTGYPLVCGGGKG